MSSSDRKSLPSYTNGVCFRVKRVRGKENETGSTNSFPAAAVAIPTALLLILEEVDVERIRDIVEPMRLKYVPSGPNGARRLQHHWNRHLNETKAEFAYGIEVFGYCTIENRLPEKYTLESPRIARSSHSYRRWWWGNWHVL